MFHRRFLGRLQDDDCAGGCVDVPRHGARRRVPPAARRVDPFRPASPQEAGTLAASTCNPTPTCSGYRPREAFLKDAVEAGIRSSGRLPAPWPRSSTRWKACSGSAGTSRRTSSSARITGPSTPASTVSSCAGAGTRAHIRPRGPSDRQRRGGTAHPDPQDRTHLDSGLEQPGGTPGCPRCLAPRLQHPAPSSGARPADTRKRRAKNLGLATAAKMAC